MELNLMPATGDLKQVQTHIFMAVLVLDLMLQTRIREGYRRVGNRGERSPTDPGFEDMLAEGIAP